MEMLDEEIKVTVAKEMEAEKVNKLANTKPQEPKKQNFRFGPVPFSKFNNGKLLGEEEEEPLLDRRTARKVNRLYHGNEKSKTAVGSNRMIINEILDVGRLEFLKTQRTNTQGGFRFRKENFNVPSTAGSIWNTARNFNVVSTPYMMTTNKKILSPLTKPNTTKALNKRMPNYQEFLASIDPKRKEKEKIATIMNMQQGIFLIHIRSKRKIFRIQRIS